MAPSGCMSITRVVVCICLVMAATEVGAPRAANLNTAMAHHLIPEDAPETRQRFGAAVQIWTSRHNQTMLVIGAPSGYVTVTNVSYPLGRLYMCPVETLENCSVHNPQPLFPNTEEKPKQQENRNLAALSEGEYVPNYGMGLGHTLYSNKNAKYSNLMACAPWYPRKLVTPLMSEPSMQVRGACYILEDKNEATSKFLIPFNHNAYRYAGSKRKLNTGFWTGNAMMGFSMATDKEGKYIYLGGPGAFNLQGIISRAPVNNINIRARQVSWTRNSAYQKTNRTEEDIYEGWALIVGTVLDSNKQVVVTSVPDELDLFGKIKFYSSDLKSLNESISGDEYGSRFGYALAAADVNSDGIDDLLVGAPMAKGMRNKPETGKVLLYYGPITKDSVYVRLEGQDAWGRFGHAIICPGDFDRDGYIDCVVGAPYSNKGAGAVYIFNGGVDGLGIKPTQIIRSVEFSPSMIKNKPILGFGYSLDGADVDKNGFIDLLVGAPDSESAMLIRSAPVVTLEGSLNFSNPLLEISNMSCEIIHHGEKVKASCFTLSITLAYDGSSTQINHDAELTLSLSSTEIQLQAFFWGNGQKILIKNITILPDDYSSTWNETLYVRRSRKRSAIITASAKVELLTESVDKGNSDTNIPAIPPMLDSSSKEFDSSVELVCSDDTTCTTHSDLTLTANLIDTVIIGEDDIMINLNVSASNDKAYDVYLLFRHHTSLKVMNVKLSSINIPCTYENPLKTHLRCELASVLRKDQKHPVRILLEQSDPFGLMAAYHQNQPVIVTVAVGTSSIENQDKLHDNNVTISINLQPKAHMFVARIVPEMLHVQVNETASWEAVLGLMSQEGTLPQDNDAGKSSVMTPQKLGPQILQTISLRNYGPSPIAPQQFTIKLPLTLDGTPESLPLLYLSQAPTTHGPVNCTLPMIDYLHLADKRDQFSTEIPEKVSHYEVPVTTEYTEDGFTSSTLGSSEIKTKQNNAVATKPYTWEETENNTVAKNPYNWEEIENTVAMKPYTEEEIENNIVGTKPYTQEDIDNNTVATKPYSPVVTKPYSHEEIENNSIYTEKLDTGRGKKNRTKRSIEANEIDQINNSDIEEVMTNKSTNISTSDNKNENNISSKPYNKNVTPLKFGTVLPTESIENDTYNKMKEGSNTEADSSEYSTMLNQVVSLESSTAKDDKENSTEKRLKNVDCNTIPCQEIVCSVDGLNKDEVVSVELRVRVVVAVFDKISGNFTAINIGSELEVEPTESWVKVQLRDEETGTMLNLRRPKKEQSWEDLLGMMDLWYWLLALLISVLIILIIMLCLWKAGFFKRNRAGENSSLITQPNKKYSNEDNNSRKRKDSEVSHNKNMDTNKKKDSADTDKQGSLKEKKERRASITNKKKTEVRKDSSDKDYPVRKVTRISMMDNAYE